MSDDGAVVFLETTDSLAAGDTDGGLFDVYAMHTADGSIEMISPPGGAPAQAPRPRSRTTATWTTPHRATTCSS